MNAQHVLFEQGIDGDRYLVRRAETLGAIADIDEAEADLARDLVSDACTPHEREVTRAMIGELRRSREGAVRDLATVDERMRKAGALGAAS